MHTPDDKKKLLDELEEIPIVSIVARRVGISKSTIYKWRDEDEKFSKAMDRAIKRGRGNITDLAEGTLVTNMKKGDFRSVKYWLDNNERRYYKPRKPIDAPRVRREIKAVEVHVVNKVDDYRSGYNDGFEKGLKRGKRETGHGYSDVVFDDPPQEEPPFIDINLDDNPR